MTPAACIQLRPPRSQDAFVAALLLNSTQEPHFHATAAGLRTAFGQRPNDYVVSEMEGQVTGLASLWLPDVHPTHGWLGLHIHPDCRADGTAQALLNHLAGQVRKAGRGHLWTSVREDYLSAWPDLEALGFREIHRTFGGGFHLRGWAASARTLDLQLEADGYTVTAAAPFQQDARLHALYALTRADKVLALPTIPAASDALTGGDGTDEDTLWNAAHIAWQAGEPVGLSLPERSRLHAWNAVLIVHPAHRGRGLATALLARTARQLQANGVDFLNVAGSSQDSAYLGVLRRLGANIEPDWIAHEAQCTEQPA
ncbi:GNAT family N-acetyltransferase [Deinococcus frigens]|uniref:GNAT family N-acetyltransferase n=1 Tax=Deinococcus frigens TaxID=249403 RepID=UPI000496FD57|nr:GNAT family N-acetyltransferase [Deinococcus frigens]